MAQDTRFNYSIRHVNHRIFTGGLVAFIGIAVLFVFGDAPPFFRALLAVGVVVVLFYILRYNRLRAEGVTAIRIDDRGLDVAAWGVGPIPWSEIAEARIAARSTIQVRLRDPRAWLDRMSMQDRLLRQAESIFGAGPFAIDCGVLDAQPVVILEAIRRRLPR